MTRRDTIIIATLVNAGLLACLFITATREEERVLPITTEAYEVAEAEPEKRVASLNDADEVDLALKEFLPEVSHVRALTNESADDERELEADLNPDLAKAPPTVALVLTEPPAPPPAIPAQLTDVRTVEVKVKKGDMLAKIAKANGTTVKAIKEANGLTSDNLKVGQVLKVPIGTVPPAKRPLTPASTLSLADASVGASGSPVYYTVQSGDNPWKIAKKFHVKFEDILKLNNMTEEKSKNLKIGQEIRVK